MNRPEYIMASISTIKLMEKIIEEDRRFQEIFTPNGLRALFWQAPSQEKP